MEKKLEYGNFLSFWLLIPLNISQLIVPGSTQLVIHRKKNGVYTPMGGSPTTSVLVYALFRVSPQLKAKTFTLVLIRYSKA